MLKRFLKYLLFSPILLQVATEAVHAEDGFMPTLQEAEQVVLENSVEMKTTRMEIESAGIKTRARIRDMLPSLNFSYNQNRSIANREYDTASYSTQVSISQPIYDGGRRYTAYEIATIDEKIARMQLATSHNELLLKTRQTYFELLIMLDQISLAKTNLNNVVFLKQQSEVENRQKSIPELEYREIQNEYQKRLLAVDNAITQYKYKLGEFAAMMRMSPEQVAGITPFDINKIELRKERILSLDLAAEMQNSNPELVKVRYQLLSARKQYLSTRYPWLPVVSVNASYGKSGNEWPPTQIQYGVGLSLSFKVFGNSVNTSLNKNSSNGGNTQGYSGQSSVGVYDDPQWSLQSLNDKIKLVKTDDQYRTAVRKIQNEAAKMAADFRQLLGEVAILEKTVEINENRFKVETERYRIGEITYNDLLIVEGRLQENRLSLMQKRAELVLLPSKLEVTMGVPVDSLALIAFPSMQSRDGERKKLWESSGNISQ